MARSRGARNDREFLVAYTFEGRNAHQTLGMLLTRRLDRMGVGPLGFVVTDYSLAIWSIRPMDDLEHHGQIDVWSSPLATLARGAGDCEDYAIAKFIALQRAGIHHDSHPRFEQAAQILGMSRVTLWRRMRANGME